MNKRESKVSIIATIGLFLIVFGTAVFISSGWRWGSVMILLGLTFTLMAAVMNEQNDKRALWLIWAYLLTGALTTLDSIVQFVHLFTGR